MTVKELVFIPEMVSQFKIIQFLYPNLTIDKYQNYLSDMVMHNYIQIAVFNQDLCVGLTGCWFGTKLWTGKYMEIDNFIVHPDYRNKGIGKIMTDFVNQKAEKMGCTAIVLDAFTTNFTAHRFYFNQGYVPKGFHFIKTIDENGFS